MHKLANSFARTPPDNVQCVQQDTVGFGTLALLGQATNQFVQDHYCFIIELNSTGLLDVFVCEEHPD